MENNDKTLEMELEPEDGEQWRDAEARHPDVKHAARDLGLFAYVHSSSDFTCMKVIFFKVDKADQPCESWMTNIGYGRVCM